MFDSINRALAHQKNSTMQDPRKNSNYGFKRPQTSKTRGKGLNHGVYKMPANTINKTKLLQPVISKPGDLNRYTAIVSGRDSGFFRQYRKAQRAVNLTPTELLKELLLEYARSQASLVPGARHLVGPFYPLSNTDESASAALVTFAKWKLPSVGTLSENDKKRLLDKNPDMLLPIVVYELATGTGKGRWEFDGWSNVFRRYYQGYVVNDLMQGFIESVNRTKITYEDFYKNYKRHNSDAIRRIRVSLNFSPDQGISILESLRRHQVALHNWVQLLIAGAVAFVYPAEDGWAEVVIHADVSRRSLLLHLGKSYDRKDYQLLYYHVPPLSTVEIRLTTRISVSREYFTKKV